MPENIAIFTGTGNLNEEDKMITKRMEEAINKQINAELYSAYLYASMAAYFESQGLAGFASWMRVQFEEEQFHAFRFFDWINERNGRVTLTPIEGPQTEWKDPVDVFENTQAHEAHVTSLINDLMSIAIEEKDYATVNFLQWFVNEQVEEESTAAHILDELRMVYGNGQGLLMLDRELGTRVFTPPTV